LVAYLLDTNHASPLVTVNHPLRKRIVACIESGDTFALCVPVLTEALFGISLVPRAVQNRAEWQHWQTRLRCYTPDETDAVEAAELQIRLRRHGWQLGTVDALIAVVVLRYKLTLLTTDGDFDPINSLKLENWLT
jgi:predicted nucleic acid-binding protein